MGTEQGITLKSLADQVGLEVLYASSDYKTKLITTAVINGFFLKLCHGTPADRGPQRGRVSSAVFRGGEARQA